VLRASAATRTRAFRSKENEERRIGKGREGK